MNVDEFGIAHYSTNELSNILYKNPGIDLENFEVDDPDQFNSSSTVMFSGYKKLKQYRKLGLDLGEFDRQNQSNWYMPTSYKEMDIAKWVLEQCSTDAELQRAGEELLIYADRDLLDLLQLMKYLVDTFRKNKVVWGVGRGSSVASFVLYKIGVHKIDSLYYQLPIDEFLK